jgi:hypothetical protein
MTYRRYWLHWYMDRREPLNAGRALSGRNLAEAVEEAAALWDAGFYASATGFCVVDTEDGSIVWRSGRRPSPSRTSQKTPGGQGRVPKRRRRPTERDGG